MADIQFRGALHHSELDEDGKNVEVHIQAGEVMAEEDAKAMVPNSVLRGMYEAGLIEVVMSEDDLPFGPEPEVPDESDVVFEPPEVPEDEEDDEEVEDSEGSPSPEE